MDWTIIKDYGSVTTSFFSIILSYCVSRINKEQKEINKSAYNLNLFKERFAIYSKFKSFYDEKNIIYSIRSNLIVTNKRSYLFSLLKLDENITKWIKCLKKVSKVVDEISLLFQKEFEEEEYLYREKEEFLKLIYYINEAQKESRIFYDIEDSQNEIKEIEHAIKNGNYMNRFNEQIFIIISQLITLLNNSDQVYDFKKFDDKNTLLLMNELKQYIMGNFYYPTLTLSKEESSIKYRIKYHIEKLNKKEKDYISHIHSNIKEIKYALKYFSNFHKNNMNKYEVLIESVIENNTFFEKIIKFMENNLVLRPYESKTFYQKFLSFFNVIKRYYKNLERLFEE